MKNILIIGASSGIGAQLAMTLRSGQHRIYGTYNENQIQSTDLDLSYSYLNVLQDDLDLSFLPDRLDGLVYCPGSIMLKPFERIKMEEFRFDFELQVLGAIKILQKTIPLLKKSDKASVVLFSSVAAQIGLPYHSVVSSNKGAIEGLTKSLAAEYATKIRFNVIAPSLTDTPLAKILLNTQEKRDSNAARHPMKRIGTAQDMAEIAAFLLSEKASWITGQIIHVDGGMSTIR